MFTEHLDNDSKFNWQMYTLDFFPQNKRFPLPTPQFMVLQQIM